MPKITIYTLAERLNMTPSMVSRAFNPKARISAEKRRVVLLEAERCGFTPNRHASRLSMREISVGIIINCRFKVNTEKMLLGIERAHERLRDYKVHYDVTVLRDDEYTMDDYERAIDKYKSYDGVIVTGMGEAKYSPLLSELCSAVEAVAQVQSANADIDTLLVSKHDECMAAEMGAEFLYNCMRGASDKSVLLFTGKRNTALHSSAHAAFSASCERLGIRLLDSIDMQDKEEMLDALLPETFLRFGDKIGGVYITSGFSIPLCKYLESRGLKIPLVTFDIYEEIREYMNSGVISATISQDVAGQMQRACELLSEHLINGRDVRGTVTTDPQLVMRSNMRRFD